MVVVVVVVLSVDVVGFGVVIGTLRSTSTFSVTRMGLRTLALAAAASLSLSTITVLTLEEEAEEASEAVGLAATPLSSKPIHGGNAGAFWFDFADESAEMEEVRHA